MEWKSTRIGIMGSDGHSEPGEVGQCDECGNDARLWFLFRVNDQLHVQCNWCDHVHCLHEGECTAVEVWDFDSTAPVDDEKPFVPGREGDSL